MTDTLADKMHTALMAERPLLRARQADICADVATDYYAELVEAVRAPVMCVVCKDHLSWYDSPGGSWWSHVHHPEDEHEAIPGLSFELTAALDAIEHPEAGR